jgi:hypothetical protein
MPGALIELNTDASSLETSYMLKPSEVVPHTMVSATITFNGAETSQL